MYPLRTAISWCCIFILNEEIMFPIFHLCAGIGEGRELIGKLGVCILCVCAYVCACVCVYMCGKVLIRVVEI